MLCVHGQGEDATILRKSFLSVCHAVCKGSLSLNHSANNLPSSISRTAYGKKFWRIPKFKQSKDTAWYVYGFLELECRTGRGINPQHPELPQDAAEQQTWKKNFPES